MSAISALAQTFEKSAKEQASATTQAVASALKQHEANLIELLSSSEQSLKSAIQRHSQTSTRAILKTWAMLALSIALVLVASFGALWWTGQQVAANIALIEQQKAAMAKASVLGIQFQSENGVQIIVLPQGFQPETGWKVSGRQAIKLQPER